MSDLNNTEAYAVFDSSDGSLTFFRDTPGLYTNNQVDGTKTYYTGIETTNYASASDISWYSNRTSITSIVFEDEIRPVSTALWFNRMSNSSFTSITNLDKLDTSNVTNMESMFFFCTNLTSLNVSHFDTSNVTNMSDMFDSCESLTSLDVSHFDTSNVTNMSLMFASCNKLTSLDVSSFNTSNVTDMSYMFSSCSHITSLDLSHFDTSNVTNMNYMFYYCQDLITTLNIANMPSSYEGMCYIAAIASGSQITLKYISPVTSANIDTLVATKSNNSNVINGEEGIFIPPKRIEKLFKISQSLPSDLEYISSTIQSSTGKNIRYAPIYDSQNHKVQAEIWSTDLDYTGEQIKLNIKAQASDSIDLLQETKKTKIRVKDDMVYSKPIEKDLYAEAYAVFDSSDNSLIFFRDEANKYTNNQTIGTKTYYTGIETTNYASTSDVPWYSNRTSVTSVIFVDKIAPISTAYWFHGMNNASLTSITGLNKLDTNNVTDMDHMFSNCSNLTSLDVTHFDTSKVTNMYYMFRGCSSLENFNVTHFDTSKVTNMSNMFYNCSGLTSLDITHFDTSKVTNMNSMFYNCSGFTSLDVSHFDTSKVTNMNTMFSNCRSIASLDVSHFDTSKVTSMNSMFSNCSSIASLDLSNFNTSNVTNMRYMFYNCESLTTIYVSDDWDVSGVTDSADMFDSCSNLVGGQGTTYNSSYVDKTYAKIDTSGTPGYLTYKAVSNNS